MQRVKQSMKRVIHLNYKPVVNGKPNPITLSDYVEVPRLSTYGTWRLLDTLSDQSTYNLLVTYNRLTKRGK